MLFSPVVFRVVECTFRRRERRGLIRMPYHERMNPMSLNDVLTSPMSGGIVDGRHFGLDWQLSWILAVLDVAVLCPARPRDWW